MGRRSVSVKKEVASSKISLEDIAAKAKSSFQSVVVFPEGTRTIGNCVLAWKPRTFEPSQNIRDSAIMSIQYSKKGAYTPHHTVNTGIWHLFWLSMQLQAHTVQTTWLPSSEVTAAMKDKTMEEQTAYVRTLMVRMITGAVEVAVDIDTHMNF